MTSHETRQTCTEIIDKIIGFINHDLTSSMLDLTRGAALRKLNFDIQHN